MGQYIDVKSRGARGAKKRYMAPPHTNITQVPSEATSTNSVLYTHSLRKRNYLPPSIQVWVSMKCSMVVCKTSTQYVCGHMYQYTYECEAQN